MNKLDAWTQTRVQNKAPCLEDVALSASDDARSSHLLKHPPLGRVPIFQAPYLFTEPWTS